MNDSDLKYDQHQFAGYRPWPTTSRIDFTDFQRMHTERHTLFGSGRKLPTPPWVLDNEQLQLVIVEYLERRAHQRTSGTLTERLQAARNKIFSQRVVLQRILETLSEEYRTTEDPIRKRALQTQLENVNTRLRVDARGAAPTVLACAYLYYRDGLTSVEVSHILGVSPQCVRQMIYRLNRIAADLQTKCPDHLDKSNSNGNDA
jgi:hypothetical protein